MFKMISKGWKTGIIGIIIIAASIYSVFKPGSTITWGDAAIPMGIGLALLLAPDDFISRLRNNNNAAPAAAPVCPAPVAPVCPVDSPATKP